MSENGDGNGNGDGNKPILMRTEASAALRDCERRFTSLETRVVSIDNALFGVNGTGGLMVKITNIEMQTGFARFIAQAAFGIACAIVAAIILKVV